MSEDAAPQRIWLQWPHGWEKYGTIERSLVIWDFQRVWDGDVEYIRADVAQAHLDAERKRIVDAIDAIVGMNPSFDVHLYAQAIKAAVWNDEDEPQEILKRELRSMPK